MNGSPISAGRAAEASSVRLIATLAVAGLLSGLIIATVYESTLPTITAYKAKMLRQAVFTVLPGVSTMEQLVYRDGRLLAAADKGKDEEAVFAGYDADGRLLGYAIPAAGPGFQDLISLLYGYLPQERRVVGMAVLESRETPGLGDKIYKDRSFVDSFSSLRVDPQILAVKKGTSSAPNEVDAITGATISSKAVVRIINQSLERWDARLQAVADEQRGAAAAPRRD